MCVWVHVDVRVCACVCVHVREGDCEYVCVRVCVYVCMCVGIYKGNAHDLHTSVNHLTLSFPTHIMYTTSQNKIHVCVYANV
jgi:hypothetical protein